MEEMEETVETETQPKLQVGSAYESLILKDQTVVFLPRNVQYRPEFKIEATGAVIPGHYHRGIRMTRPDCGDYVFINMCYFGFSKNHLNKNVLARVEIQKKTRVNKLGDNIDSLVINVHREGEQNKKTKAQFMIKIGVEVGEVDLMKGGPEMPVLIPYTNKCILFRRIK